MDPVYECLYHTGSGSRTSGVPSVLVLYCFHSYKLHSFCLFYKLEAEPWARPCSRGEGDERGRSVWIICWRARSSGLKEHSSARCGTCGRGTDWHSVCLTLQRHSTHTSKAVHFSQQQLIGMAKGESPGERTQLKHAISSWLKTHIFIVRPS